MTKRASTGRRRRIGGVLLLLSCVAAVATGPDAAMRYERGFQESLDQGRPDEAATLAKQRLESLLVDPVSDDIEIGRVQADLGLAQHRDGDHASAIRNFQAARTRIANATDPLNRELMPVLQGLGSALHSIGATADSLQTMELLLHIVQVNDGPHSLAQLGYLEDMWAVTLDAGDIEAGLPLLRRAELLVERAHSTQSVELLPVLERRAQTYDLLDRHGAERLELRRAVDILVAARGEDDPALVEPYLRLARSYLHETDKVVYRSAPTTETGETWLERALAIAELREREDPRMLYRCLLNFGDYYQLFSVDDLAARMYRRAWALATQYPVLLPLRRAELEQPVVLSKLSIGRYANFGYDWNAADLPDEELTGGHLVAAYTVSERGRTTDIEFVDADPQGFVPMEYRVRRSIRELVYRPRFESGEPVETRGNILRHEFLYLPVDPD